MEYSQFLFSKIFINANKDISEKNYDTQYEEIKKAYTEYDTSVFNNSNRSEYECMDEFIKEYSYKEDESPIKKILEEALDREKLVLSFGLKNNKEQRSIQQGRIEGLELALILID